MSFNTGIAVGAIFAIILPSAQASSVCAKAAKPAAMRLAARIDARIENRLDGNSWYIADKFRKLAQTREEQGAFLVTVEEINSALMRSLTAFEYLRLIPPGDRDERAMIPFGNSPESWGLGFQVGRNSFLETADFIPLLEIVPPYANGQDPEIGAPPEHIRARQKLGFDLRRLTDTMRRDELSELDRETHPDAALTALDREASRLRETLALILLETRALIQAQAANPTPLRVRYLGSDSGPVPVQSDQIPRTRFLPPPFIFRSTDVYPETPGPENLGHRNGSWSGRNGAAANGHAEVNGRAHRP